MLTHVAIWGLTVVADSSRWSRISLSVYDVEEMQRDVARWFADTDEVECKNLTVHSKIPVLSYDDQCLVL